MWRSIDCLLHRNNTTVLAAFSALLVLTSQCVAIIPRPLHSRDVTSLTFNVLSYENGDEREAVLECGGNQINFAIGIPKDMSFWEIQTASLRGQEKNG